MFDGSAALIALVFSFLFVRYMDVLAKASRACIGIEMKFIKVKQRLLTESSQIVVSLLNAARHEDTDMS